MKFTQICVLLVGLLGVTASQTGISLYNKFLNKNNNLYMVELAKKHGYQIEEHVIITEDGYILNTYRIPPGEPCANQTVKKPVLFAHGLFSSSFDYIAGGPKKSLAYSLADKCYDIWLLNSRGNGVSKGHVNLNTSDPKFWDFSWHEMGMYDVPAAIDYILNETNETSLHYLGHSQGTTEFFVFAAMHPEYHSKITSMQALAPAVLFHHSASLLLNFVVYFFESLEILLRSLGIHDLNLICDIIRGVGTELCNEDKYPEIADVCLGIVDLLAGGDVPEMNTTVLFSSFLQHFPAGAATKQLYHYGQLVKNHKFRQYDYGIYKNEDVYGSMFPPEYNLSSINVPISLYYSLSDNMVNSKDVEDLYKILPNVTEFYLVPYANFTHVDFIIAIDAHILIWDRVIKIIETFN